MHRGRHPIGQLHLAQWEWRHAPASTEGKAGSSVGKEPTAINNAKVTAKQRRPALIRTPLTHTPDPEALVGYQRGFVALDQEGRGRGGLQSL